MDDISKKLTGIQVKANESDIEVDVYGMYSCFYEQHKQKHGSYKPFVLSPEYETLMNSRYNWILEQISEVIDCKIKYKNLEEKT